jgi:hypothetical protein
MGALARVRTRRLCDDDDNNNNDDDDYDDNRRRDSVRLSGVRD